MSIIELHATNNKEHQILSHIKLLPLTLTLAFL